MASFDSDNPNPEEEIGGFQAGEQGDETFKISSMDSYPGDMPEAFPSEDKPLYDSATDETIISTDSPDESEAPAGDIDEDLEADSPGDDQDDQWDMMDDTEEDFIGINESEPRDIDEDTESSEEKDPYDDLFGDEPVSKDKVTSKNPALVEESFDDDLKNIINSELARSKKRKEDKPDDENPFDQKVVSAAPLVVSDEPEGTTSELDLSDIDADRPSTYGLEKSESIETPAHPPNDSKSEKPEKEKKKRSGLFWPAVIGAAAILIIATALGTWYFLNNGNSDKENYRLYLSLKNFGFELDIPEGIDTVEYISGRMEDFLDDEGTIDNAKVKEYLEKNGLADNTLQNDEPNLDGDFDTSMIPDTIIPDESLMLNDSAGGLEDENPFREDIKLNPDSEIDNYIITQDDLVSAKKPATQKPKSENIPAKPVRNTVKEDIKKNPFRNNENEKTDETVTPFDEDIVELEQTTPKPVGKTDRADDILDKIRDRQEPDSDSQRSYTVQVFSTLSEEDAEIWKQKLQNRRVGKAYISEHVIRDQTWYRVRVGDYSTREEAMRIARKLGYAQVWVDRIR